MADLRRAKDDRDSPHVSNSYHEHGTVGQNDEDNRALVGERRTMASAAAHLATGMTAPRFAVKDRDREECLRRIGGTFAPRPDGT